MPLNLRKLQIFLLSFLEHLNNFLKLFFSSNKPKEMRMSKPGSTGRKQKTLFNFFHVKIGNDVDYSFVNLIFIKTLSPPLFHHESNLLVHKTGGQV